MAQRLELNEINNRFEMEGKPIKIIGNFSNVHSTALFECSKGHQFDDVVLNVMHRRSTTLKSYCPECGYNVYKLDDEGNRLLNEVNASERTKLPVLNQSLDILNKEMIELSERIRVINIEIRHVKRFTINARKDIARKSKIRIKQAKLLAKKAAKYHLTIIQDLAAHPSRRWGVMLHDKRLISFQTESECNTWASIHYFEKTGELWSPDN